MNDVSFMISGDAMKIITCYKCVPDEQDIAVNNADGSLDFSKADAKISQYDLNAIEAACQLKQQAAEAQVTALSVGGKALTNAKGRKDVLSRGPDELIVVIKCPSPYIGDVTEYSINNDIRCIQISDCKPTKYADDY